MQNSAVREEMCRIMGFWLELGVSGFRVDAVPFVIETVPLSDYGKQLAKKKGERPSSKPLASRRYSVG